MQRACPGSGSQRGARDPPPHLQTTVLSKVSGREHGLRTPTHGRQSIQPSGSAFPQGGGGPRPGGSQQMAVTTPSWGPEGRKEGENVGLGPRIPPSRSLSPVPEVGASAASRGAAFLAAQFAGYRVAAATSGRRLAEPPPRDLSCRPQTNSPDSQGWGNRFSSRSCIRAEPGCGRERPPQRPVRAAPPTPRRTHLLFRAPHEACAPRIPAVTPTTTFTAWTGLSRL